MHSEIDFPEADHILKALRLNRTPGWNYPANHLGMGFHSVDTDQAILGMEAEPHLDTHGRPLPVSLAVFADVALAAAVRGRVGGDFRLATVSASLSFTGAPASQPLRAVSTCGFLTRAPSTMSTGQSASLAAHGEAERGDTNAVPQAAPHGGAATPAAKPGFFTGNSSLSVASGNTVICTGTANFAVLENRHGTAPHPMPGVRDFSHVKPLPLHELTAAEQQLLARAREASRSSSAGHGTPFLDHFWGLIPVRTEQGAECEFPCGMHVGNRVGHTQGGILLGLAMSTSMAAPGPGWRVLDVAANFVSPGQGNHLQASGRLLRAGRHLAQVMCHIKTDEGRLVLSALSTLVRDESPC